MQGDRVGERQWRKVSGDKGFGEKEESQTERQASQE